MLLFFSSFIILILLLNTVSLGINWLKYCIHFSFEKFLKCIFSQGKLLENKSLYFNNENNL